MEEVLAFRLFRKVLARPEFDWKIYSVVGRASLPGSIFIEAADWKSVQTVCEGMLNVYCRHPGPIDPAEAPSVLREPSNYTPKKYSWIHLKQFPYKGDLAFVTDVDPSGIEVYVVPRINLRDIAPGKRSKYTRAPRALFDAAKIRSTFGSHAVNQVNQAYIFKSRMYKDGLLQLSNVQSYNVDIPPTREELILFPNCQVVPKEYIQIGFNLALAAEFGIDDAVKIIAGASKGIAGKIQSIQMDEAKISTLIDDRELTVVEKLKNLRKRILIGDIVIITIGEFEGFSGWVVSSDNQTVTIYNPKIGKQGGFQHFMSFSY